MPTLEEAIQRKTEEYNSMSRPEKIVFLSQTLMEELTIVQHGLSLIATHLVQLQPDEIDKIVWDRKNDIAHNAAMAALSTNQLSRKLYAVKFLFETEKE